MTFGTKDQAGQRPTAFGTMLQASTYGMAVPQIYGMTMSNLLAIWASNLRKGSASNKKLKQFLKKQQVYIEGVDFLIGKNPIFGVNQLWINGSTIPLQLKTATFTIGYRTGGSPVGTYTIVDDNFYSVVGLSATGAYSVSFDDYGAPGTATASGDFEIPFWNQLQAGPDPSDPGSFPFRSLQLSLVGGLWEQVLCRLGGARLFSAQWTVPRQRPHVLPHRNAHRLLLRDDGRDQLPVPSRA